MNLVEQVTHRLVVNIADDYLEIEASSRHLLVGGVVAASSLGRCVSRSVVSKAR